MPGAHEGGAEQQLRRRSPDDQDGLGSELALLEPEFVIFRLGEVDDQPEEAAAGGDEGEPPLPFVQSVDGPFARTPLAGSTADMAPARAVQPARPAGAARLGGSASLAVPSSALDRSASSSS